MGFELTRRDDGGHDRHRPSCSRSWRCCAAKGGGGQVRGILRRGPRHAAAGGSGDDRQHGAGIRGHLRLLPHRRRKRCAICATPARPEEVLDLGRDLCQGERLLAGRGLRARSIPTRSASTCAPSCPRISGPKRPQDYTTLDRAARAFFEVVLRVPRRRTNRGAPTDMASGRKPTPDALIDPRRTGQGRRRGVRAARRLGRDRLDHLLHEHLQPLRDDRRGAGGAQGARTGPDPQAMGQDLARAGVAGGFGLSGGRGPAGGSGRHRLQPRGLWLHDLHRQLRPAAARDLQGDQRQRPDRDERPVGQPQLRGPDQPGRAGETTSPRRRSWWPMRWPAT